MTSGYGSLSPKERCNGDSQDAWNSAAGAPTDNQCEIGDETTPLVSPSSATPSIVVPKQAFFDTWLTFGWLTPLLEYGNSRKHLDPSDLSMAPLPEDCTTSVVTDIFEKFWAHEIDSKKKPSLLRALYRSYGQEFITAGLLKLLHDCLAFVGPVVLHAMIFYLRDEDAPHSRGLALAATVGVSQMGMSLAVRHYFFKCYKTGLRIRTAVVLAVYKKALALSSGERQSRTSGEITNLMSIDAQRLQDITTYLHGIWYNCFQIFVALYFLWHQLGSSCLAGIATMIIVMPLTRTVAQGVAKLQKGLMKARDERVNINSEVLSSMKTVKIQAWEEPFYDRIMGSRSKELKALHRYWIYTSVTGLIWNGTPLAVALSTFAAFVFSGHNLDVASALTSLALFDILRFPIFMLPQIINSIAEGLVSIQRVQSFLLCEEQHSVGPGDLVMEDQNAIGVKMHNVTAVYESKKPRIDDELLRSNPAAKDLADKDWEVQLLKARLESAEREIKQLTQRALSEVGEDPGEKEKMVEPARKLYDAERELHSANLLCLKRINFECRKGELVAICGTVGCGK